MDVGGWLRSLGLEKYEAVFRENEISKGVLPSLPVHRPNRRRYNAPAPDLRFAFSLASHPALGKFYQ